MSEGNEDPAANAPAGEAEQAKATAEKMQADYEKHVRDQSDQMIDTESAKRSEEFARIQKLGFPSVRQMQSEIDALKKVIADQGKEYLQLREFLLKQKAQGNIAIPSEDKAKEQKHKLRELYGDLGFS